MRLKWTMQRYVLREVVQTWLAVTGVLVAILVSNQLSRVLGLAADNNYGRGVVFQLVALGAIMNLSVVVPVGLLLAIVLALGRLYHDSEMTALQACGFGAGRLLGPLFCFGAVIAVGLAWLVFVQVPRADNQVQLLRQSALKEAQFGQLDAGRFRSFSGGDGVFYAERVDQDGVLHNVFVQREVQGRVEVALADTATYAKAAEGSHLVTLYNGRRYEGTPGQPNFRITEFREHGIPIAAPAEVTALQDPDTKPTPLLLASHAPRDIATLQFRTSTPIMALVLTLIAVPLSRLRPRQGRYARVGFAIVVFFVYSNLLSAAKSWVARGSLPPVLGMWWVHALALAFGLWLVLRQGAPDMNTLDRYLYRTVLVYAGMAMAVLLTLAGLFLFIAQQRDIGTGSYSTGDAFLYTLLNIPQQATELLPIAAMIGTLMGLGNLAAGSELVVTRASGVSVWRIAWPVGLAGVTLALLMFGLGEYAAPPLAQFAKREKTTDKMSDVSFAGVSSAWVKDGNTILRVQTGDAESVFGGVAVFELESPTKLSSIERATRISVGERNRWMLKDVQITHFGKDRVVGESAGESLLKSTVNPDFMGLAAADPDLLTLRALKGYIEHLKRNSLETEVFEIGYWTRIARLFGVVVVTLLALPFVFGPLRSSGAGARTVIGVLLGVVFFLVTSTIEKGGQLFTFDPLIVGWLPTVVVAFATLVAIARTR